MTNKNKIITAAITTVALMGAGGCGYVVKHNADVAHAKEVKQAKIERAYQADMKEYKAELAVWTEKNDKYESLVTAMEPVYASADKIEGMIATGGYDIDELSDAIHETSSELNTAVRSIDIIDGYAVARNVEKAIVKWSDASEIWREWEKDIYDTRELDDLPLDGPFRKASNYMAASEGALDAMNDPNKPIKPQRPTTNKE